jgi:hypothetical protein
MAKAKPDTSYRYILAASRKTGLGFKAYCATEGMSINKALNLLMKSAIKGNFTHKEIMTRKKAKKASKV